MGPDGIHPRVMRELADELTKPLHYLPGEKEARGLPYSLQLPDRKV